MTAPYVDIASLTEDQRISLMAHQVIDHDQTVGFVVEDEAKAERYIKKLKTRFPEIIVDARGPGPIAGTVMVKIRKAYS